MSGIFICYRREDSEWPCGRIYEHLVGVFGKDAVFKDVFSIPTGVNFRKYIQDKLRDCTVLLAVIGKQWASTVGEDGQRRLDDPNDSVRLEIEEAFRLGIIVIPVLVEGAQMPSERQLPESMHALPPVNGIKLRGDPDFTGDIGNLVAVLDKSIPRLRPATMPAPAMMGPMMPGPSTQPIGHPYVQPPTGPIMTAHPVHPGPYMPAPAQPPGPPPAKKAPVWLIISIVAGVLVVACVGLLIIGALANAGGGGGGNTSPTATTAPDVWNVELQQASTDTSFNGYAANAGYYFVLPQVVVENQSSQAQILRSTFFSLKDDTGQIYDESQASNPGQSVSVDPGQTTTQEFSYLVPDNVCNFTLYFIPDHGSQKSWTLTSHAGNCP